VEGVDRVDVSPENDERAASTAISGRVCPPRDGRGA
jgi:hypothetical protein